MDEVLAHVLGNKTTAPPKAAIENLARLYANAAPEEYAECHDNWLNKRFKTSLEKLIVGWGHKIGTIKDSEYKQKKHLAHLGKSTESIFKVDFWVRKRGYNLEDAKNIVSQYQRNNANKAHYKGRNYKKENPISLEYWRHRGYTNEEAECLRGPYLNVCATTLDAFIDRWGLDVGTIKFYEKQLKWQNTLKTRYNVTSFCELTRGAASKQSLKVFVPLYKKLRRVYRLQTHDIAWGISGSREYVLRDTHRDMVYFYDFTIRPWKIIIEFNGTFWHPKSENDTTWEGTRRGISVSEKWNYDSQKNVCARTHGFTVLTVWSDDTDPHTAIERFLHSHGRI